MRSPTSPSVPVTAEAHSAGVADCVDGVETSVARATPALCPLARRVAVVGAALVADSLVALALATACLVVVDPHPVMASARDTSRITVDARRLLRLRITA